ncbi:hypothetical protein ACSBR2_026713 [Camellia fascicularis]
MNNRCAKFKTKPLEHVDLIERVHFGAATIEKHAWTPTELRDDAAAATNANEDSGMGPLSSAMDGSANAKRLKRPAPGTVASSMDNLMEAVSEQSRELKITQFVVPGKSDNTVGDCLARLMSTFGLEPGGKLFSFACGIMDSPDNWDIIMALPVNYIMNWLTEKHACMPTNVGRDREWGTQLFGSDGAVDLD